MTFLLFVPRGVQTDATLLLDDSDSQPAIVAAVSGEEIKAAGGTAVLRKAAPNPSPSYFLSRNRNAQRIGDGVGFVIGVAVQSPFAHVSAHVVEPPGIWRKGTDVERAPRLRAQTVCF